MAPTEDQVKLLLAYIQCVEGKVCDLELNLKRHHHLPFPPG